MSDTLTYQQMGTAARGQTHALFAQTMGYVAATAALFALGAWAGHDLTGGAGHCRVHRGLRVPDRHAVRGAPVRCSSRSGCSARSACWSD